MILCKIFKLFFYNRKGRLERVISSETSEEISIKRYSSNFSFKRNKNSSWYSFLRQWKLFIPVGAGISVFAILQWKYLKKYPHSSDKGATKEYFDKFIVKCYCSLPLRITSRIWGWMASREVPVNLRTRLYKFYATTFSANLDEIGADLTTFPNLVEFFVRPLKDGVRPIAWNTNMVSPSDGTVLHFGPVTSCYIEQVKGVTYNLKHFLGDVDHFDKMRKSMEDDNSNYVKSLLTDPSNCLYQLIVYLAPGDYHRFHSPTDWVIEFRRHFQGKLLSVNPKIAMFLPNLFSLNERVVYVGEWAGGFMAYAAIGATNVGSIRVYCDHDLTTNTVMWPKADHSKNLSLHRTCVSKGQMFGEFRMGSTIVLLFEAPKDFQFCLEKGQSIKVGQPLTEYVVKPNKIQKTQVA